ncbi:MAG: transcription elongation factor GreB [Gammaproteobacteria bacterium]|nr:transcription elongation factor GreB [Gammaproteobacteria bacterium]
MSRYRPPRPQSSVYITQQGKDALLAEHDELWYKKRPQVTRSVSEAAAQGDRSENAEYIYGKKQLREIDSRLRFLKKRLDVVQIVDQIPQDQSKVFFAAIVTVENEAEEVSTYHIVGADEIDLRQGKISIDSPLAKALLGKSVGDEVIFQGPKGQLVYFIEAIEYKREP